MSRSFRLGVTASGVGPRVLAATVAMVVALILTVPSGSAQTTTSTTTPSSTPATTPTGATASDAPLTLVGQSGWVAPSGVFKISLRTGSLPTDGELVVRLYSRVTTSARLEQTGRGEALGGMIQPPVLVPLDQVQRSADGLDLSFPLVASGAVPPYGFYIGATGVYPISVGLLDSDGQETGRIVTHLIRLPAPGSGQTPLAVALAVPVHAAVSHDTTGASTIDSDTVASLQGLINALNRQPTVALTVTPTPETIDALAERDRSTGGTSVASLAKASGSGRQVINDTYVGVDRGAWVGQGLSAALGAQFDAGAATLTSQLGAALDRRTLVVDPSTTPEVLSEQVTRGIAAALVPSDQLVPLDRRNNDETLTQSFDLASSNDDRIPAVAADSRLGRRLVEGDNPTFSAHEVLAELALLSLDQSRSQPCVLSSDASGCSRGIALELPSSAAAATPAVSVLLDAFADRTGTAGSPTASPGAPLASAVTVTDLLRVVDRASASFRTRSSGAVLVRELIDTTPGSLGSYPNDLRSATSAVNGYHSMTLPDDPKGSDIASSLDQVLLCSGAAEFDDATRASYLDGARSTLDNQVSLITAPGQVTVTLTSSRAKVPLSIDNALDYPVKVALRMSSAKLEFPEGSTQTVELAPSQPTRIEIPVETRASGSFPLVVTVWSPDGAVSIASTRFTVRSTAVSGVGLALTIAAGLFLVLWWGRHFRNARRDKRLVVASNHPARRQPTSTGDPPVPGGLPGPPSGPTGDPAGGSTPGPAQGSPT